jgi:hypothetical protein
MQQRAIFLDLVDHKPWSVPFLYFPFLYAMADSEFKKHAISFPGKGWTAHSAGEAIGPDQYKPDRSFANQDGKVICVIESSSTNDRKAGVGELCLADKFFCDSEVQGVLIFSLCGKALTRPTPKTQVNYLRPYFSHLQRSNSEFGVKEVYILEEKDFKELQWQALTPDFAKVALKLDG